MSRKTVIILALVLVPVALMVAGAALGIGGNALPNAHFIVAFAIGATGSVLLAVGLFALSFHSARSGHVTTRSVTKEAGRKRTRMGPNSGLGLGLQIS